MSKNEDVYLYLQEGSAGMEIIFCFLSVAEGSEKFMADPSQTRDRKD